MKTYIEWAQAQLDQMSAEGKDAIILGLVTALWPGGNTASPVSGGDLVDECNRLLGELNPDYHTLDEFDDDESDPLHAKCPECESTGPHEDNGRQPEDQDYAVKCDCGFEWTPNEG